MAKKNFTKALPAVNSASTTECHNLSFAVDGDEKTAEAMYANAGAWMNLGVVKDHISVEDCHSMVPIVELSPASYETRDIMFPDDAEKIRRHPMKDYAAVTRCDNYRQVGLVGRDYKLYQFGQMVDDMVAPILSNDATIETVIVLNGGARCCVLVKLSEQFRLNSSNDKDVLQPYLLFRTGHDYITPLSIRPTGVRVVCQNTETCAIAADKAFATIRHSGAMADKIALSKIALQQSHKAFAIKSAIMRSLHDAPASMLQVKDFALANIGNPANAAESKRDTAKTRIINSLKDYSAVYNVGGDRVQQGSWGGVYNAFTDYLEHRDASGRNTDDVERRNTNRFDSIMDGTIARRRAAAWDYVVEHSGIDIDSVVASV